MRTRWIVKVLFTLAMVVGGPGSVRAADPPPSPGQASEVTPARVSYIYGEVSFRRPGAEEWAEAKVNTPLAPGDVLYTGRDGNVEVQFGPRAFLRAGNGTQLGLDNQEPDFVQFRVTSGHAALDVRDIAAGDTVEVDTPNAAFTIERKGYYHVDLSEDTTTFRTHRGGSATMTGTAGTTAAVAANQEIVVTGTDTPTVEAGAAPPLSRWDRWNYERTAYLLQPSNTQNVSASMYGTEALAQHGNWRTVESYGSVWVPASVPPGWVPYSTGRWIWDPRFGWTWLDDAPWGWAPYHYGRWVFAGSYWAWAPGPIVVRPVYAPALVVFLGGPVRVTVGVRPLHWAPLGWGEPVIPWWGRPGFVGVAWWGGWGGPRVVNNVVVSRTTTVNVTNINVYKNVHVHNAVVAVPEERFGHGRVQPTRVDAARVRELTPVRGALEVKPVAASVMPAGGSAVTPPAAVHERNVVATRAPRDFTPTLRAQGLGADREATPSVAPRLVPAPKPTRERASVATPPAEGPSSGQRARSGETPNARRADPSAGPRAAPGASPRAAPEPGAGVPRPGARGDEEKARAREEKREEKRERAAVPPPPKQGRRPVEETERVQRHGPPAAPPPHDPAVSRQAPPRPQAAPDQRARPEAQPEPRAKGADEPRGRGERPEQGQPSQRPNERPERPDRRSDR